MPIGSIGSTKNIRWTWYHDSGHRSHDIGVACNLPAYPIDRKWTFTYKPYSTGDESGLAAETDQAITEFQMPKTKTAVRRLLGMANQYRNHIYRYAKIVDPLCRLTEGEWPTRWDSESVPEECHTALEKLKTALRKTPQVGCMHTLTAKTILRSISGKRQKP